MPRTSPHDTAPYAVYAPRRRTRRRASRCSYMLLSLQVTGTARKAIRHNRITRRAAADRATLSCVHRWAGYIAGSRPCPVPPSPEVVRGSLRLRYGRLGSLPHNSGRQRLLPQLTSTVAWRVRRVPPPHPQERDGVVWGRRQMWLPPTRQELYAICWQTAAIRSPSRSQEHCPSRYAQSRLRHTSESPPGRR